MTYPISMLSLHRQQQTIQYIFKGLALQRAHDGVRHIFSDSAITLCSMPFHNVMRRRHRRSKVMKGSEPRVSAGLLNLNAPQPANWCPGSETQCIHPPVLIRTSRVGHLNVPVSSRSWLSAVASRPTSTASLELTSHHQSLSTKAYRSSSAPNTDTSVSNVRVFRHDSSRGSGAGC